MSRIYFEGTYDSNAEGKRPDCFSDNGIGPSVASSTPAGPDLRCLPARRVDQDQCQRQESAVVHREVQDRAPDPRFPDPVPAGGAAGEPRALREYTALCKGNGALVANLVTRMWFVSQGVLGFRPVNYIDEAVAKLRQEAYAGKLTDAIVGRGDIAKPAHQIAAPAQAQGQIPFVQGPAPAVAQAQQFVPNVPQQTQQGGAFQQPSGQQWPAQGSQQVQQPGPFAPTPAGPAGSPGWPQTNAAQTAATTSPSEAPATGRRKRRTAAEIAAANGGAPGGPQQAPFPHPASPSGFAGQVPGQQAAQQPAPAGAFPQSSSPQALPGQLEFGIGPGQDAAASPEVKGMLDNFFGGQT